MEGLLCFLIVLAIIVWAVVNANKKNKSAGALPGWQLRVVNKTFGEGHDVIQGKSVQIKGLFPLLRRANVNLVVSILQMHDDGPAPVLCGLDAMQEPGSIAYQFVAPVGTVDGTQGFEDWVDIAPVLPDVLRGPYAGEQTLLVVARLIDSTRTDAVWLGFPKEEHGGIYSETTVEFSHYFEGKGYIEDAEHRDQAHLQIAQLAVAIAKSDGTVDTSEARVIKTWAKKYIASFDNDDKTNNLKTRFNDAINEAIEKSNDGSLSIGAICSKLEASADIATLYDAVELCYQVLAADEVADQNELDMVNQIVKSLGLDPDEIKRIRDTVVAGLGGSAFAGSTDEEIIGIDPSWSKQQKCDFVKTEYARWNARGASVNKQSELDNINEIKERCGRLVQKYGC